MIWRESFRAAEDARQIADRHYNRQSVGARQFVPPGRCLVLMAVPGGALWVTSWPYARYTKHAWAGAWINSLFRREARDLPVASDMIRDAVAVTLWRWPEVPPLGMVSFVDAGKVRRKRDPGRCYLRAGFTLVGQTKGGLLAFQLLPEKMPQGREPAGAQTNLFPRLAAITQPSLFDAPALPPSPSDWHELEWTNGRRYRWRLHVERFDPEDPPSNWERAPGPYRWELECERDGEWVAVRFYARRDEIWAHVRHDDPEDRGAMT